MAPRRRPADPFLCGQSRLRCALGSFAKIESSAALVLLAAAIVAVIVVNAICIPVATPQLALNLLLTFFYLGAGIIERNARASTDASEAAQLTGLPT